MHDARHATVRKSPINMVLESVIAGTEFPIADRRIGSSARNITDRADNDPQHVASRCALA